MDQVARWFSREIIVSVAQRLLLESAVAGFVVLAVTTLSGATPLVGIIAAFVSVAGFAVLRLVASCFLNPLNSPYLVRWPHPTGEIQPVGQSNAGSETDLALTALEFTARGAIDEWGGAVTNVYTRASNQIIVLTSSDDDLIVLSGLADNRLVATTKQLIPPHEQLVVNHCYEPDVKALLESHNDLLRTLAAAGHQPVAMTLEHIIELLAIEWDAWNQIGPFVGPFVSVGQRRPLGLLQVRVSSEEILERTIATPPRVTAASRITRNETPAAQAPTAPSVPAVSSVPAVPSVQQAPVPPTPVPAVVPVQDAVPAAVAHAPGPAASFPPAATFVPAAITAPPQAPVTQPPITAPPIPVSSLNRRPRRSSMQPSERVAPAIRPVSQTSAREQAA